MKTTKMKRGTRRGDPDRGFSLEIIHPGLTLGTDDSGIGAIGRIDRARIHPGHTIAMHPHRDDEILTYVRVGSMLHKDTVGNREEIRPARLMMMNAGHTFQHEETILGTEPQEALQIFLRPHAPSLEPKVQFRAFSEATSRDVWRLLAAPEGAPFEVRAQAWVHDIRVAAGKTVSLPLIPTPGAVRLLYVFSGEIGVGAWRLQTGEGAFLAEDEVEVAATTESDLVLFSTDAGAPVFKGGMFSGNVLLRA
ncbi:pirin family protein [Bradyrhizobium sp. BR 10289]|uniref:pirin family protein n=1 Tax=Bradyrhizobium sp. BR 10289 TaxID=2749993 RepID=UPI001C647BCA|nr:pirin family protein [Bradyrhizobium sp. BR 10289]MBW7974155.1 pirin family protein [Bradyrhizobium sp. BR 10289]